MSDPDDRVNDLLRKQQNDLLKPVIVQKVGFANQQMHQQARAYHEVLGQPCPSAAESINMVGHYMIPDKLKYNELNPEQIVDLITKPNYQQNVETEIESKDGPEKPPYAIARGNQKHEIEAASPQL